jgi:hypothetical protein
VLQRDTNQVRQLQLMDVDASRVYVHSLRSCTRVPMLIHWAAYKETRRDYNPDGTLGKW